MKGTITLIAALISITCLIAQPGLNITDPISVTGNSSTYGKHLPRVLSLADGTIVVFWSKSGSAGGLFLARLEGESFGEVIQIATGDLVPDIWSGGLGPSIAVHGNTVFVAFEIWGEGVYCVRSTDGGLTFGEPVVAINPDEGRAVGLPAITVDTDGNPIIGAINSTLSEQDAWYEVAKSADGGLTFGAPVMASTAADGDEVCECCPSSLHVDSDGDIYVSFRNNNSNTRDIWIVKSTDGGQTFTEAVDADATDWVIQGCPSTGPQTIRTGDDLATVFFSNGVSGTSGVYLSTVDVSLFKAGTTFKLPYIDGVAGNQNFPRISGSGDTLGMVWHENINPYFNIGFAWSVNGPGEIVEQAINVGGAANPQTYPDIYFHNGTFHIVYEDQATATVLYQTIDFQPATSILHKKQEGRKLLVFPNPARDKLTVSLPGSVNGAVNLEILDLLGRKVYSQNKSEQLIEIDIHSLKNGIYTVRATARNFTLTEKLVVEK